MPGSIRDNHPRKGFTLIEILVALGIFLMITGIAAVSYRSANRRARDGRRQADIEEVRTKLEIYRADNPGAGYPVGNWAALSAALVPTYIMAVPQDPRPTIYDYYYNGTPTIYSLCTYLEAGGVSPCPSVGSCGTVACNWCQCSP